MEYKRLNQIDFKPNIGNRVFVEFMARGVDVRSQRDGINKYIVLNMCDKGIEIEARMFGVREEVINMVQDGKIYKAAIDVKKYEKSPSGYSCILYNIDYSNSNANEFIEWMEGMAESQQRLENVLGDIIETVYGKIAYAIIVENWDKFVRWTAAKGQHHNKLGGLIVHTREVVDLCDELGDYFNETYGDGFINRALLLSSAILHDLGKIWELDVDVNTGGTEYSTGSSLSTHIMDIISAVDIMAYRLGFGEEESEEIRLLKHSLAAHHGKLEYGSPITPSTPEATILNIADSLSADMYKYNKVFKDIGSGESSSSWTSDGYKRTYKESNKN